VLILATRIDQHQFVVLELRAVLHIMQDTGIVAATDDGAIGGMARSLGGKSVLDLGLQLVFVHAGTCGLHRPTVRARTDCTGLAHQAQFLRTLEQAHLVEQMIEVHELVGGHRAGAGAGADAFDPVQ